MLQAVLEGVLLVVRRDVLQECCGVLVQLGARVVMFAAVCHCTVTTKYHVVGARHAACCYVQPCGQTGPRNKTPSNQYCAAP